MRIGEEKQELTTTYPLMQYLVAPSEGMSIDYVFNYVLFATLTVPLMLLLRWAAARLWRQKISTKTVLIVGAFLALWPFIDITRGLHKWRQDERHYVDEVGKLDHAKGEFANFTLPFRAQDPIFPNNESLKEPNATNILGTDSQGRDVFARMIHGSRVSLSVGFVAESIAVLIGVFLGALAGVLSRLDRYRHFALY